MIFVVFNLNDLQRQERNAALAVGVRFVAAASLEKAKELMSRGDGVWAVVPKTTFDQGIVRAAADP